MKQKQCGKQIWIDQFSKRYQGTPGSRQCEGKVWSGCHQQILCASHCKKLHSCKSNPRMKPSNPIKMSVGNALIEDWTLKERGIQAITIKPAKGESGKELTVSVYILHDGAMVKKDIVLNEKMKKIRTDQMMYPSTEIDKILSELKEEE